MSILERLNGLSKKSKVVISLIVTAIIGFLDYWTGFEFRMEIFYLAPISYVTWYIGKRAGILTSAVSLIAILYSDMLSGKKYYNFPVDIWNMAMYFIFFAIVVFLTSKLRIGLNKRERLIGELRGALKEVKELSGILPICANCKKIRNDEGYWEDVAAYFSTHTKAAFSHGLCKDCATKLYPQYFKKDEEK